MTITDFGKYRLLKQIDRGGMAEIFLSSTGSISGTHKFVVIKRILSGHSKDKELKKMFFNEGKAVTNISHNNIATVFDYGEENNQQYICMEYVAGCNLKRLASKTKKKTKKLLDLEVTLHIIRNTCLGLDHAHNCIDSTSGEPLNLIHRDVSPQNIMLGYNGDIKIIDFGIVKIDGSEATRVGVLKGKFVYMSPEQVKGLPLDKRTDIFSMGSVLWELLTGKKLFSGHNEIQILTKIKECKIPDLKAINPSMDSAIVKIVNKSLATNRNLRYQNIGDMANDISIYLNKKFPYFTENTFARFMKEACVEEILAEREMIKKYSKALNVELAKSQYHKKKRAKPADMPGRLKSVKSTFIGGEEDNGRKKSKSSHHTRTETQTLESHTKEDNVPSITKTKFDDTLESPKTLTRQKKASSKNKEKGLEQKIKSKTSALHGTVLQSGIHMDKEQAFSPFSKNTYMGGNTHSDISIAQSTYGRYRRQRNLMKLTFLATFVIVGIGLGYTLYQGFIVEKKWNLVHIANNLSIRFFKKEIIDRMESDTQSTSALHAPSHQNIQHRGIASVKNQEVHFDVFVDTIPSGANLTLAGKQQDKKTPTSIKVPAGQALHLTITKKGYKSVSRTIRTQNNAPPRRLHIRLKKIR